jgi:hypothetical protein
LLLLAVAVAFALIAIAEHVEIVIIPFAGRARDRCAFEYEVIFMYGA